MNGIRILGTGRYVPELSASNEDFTAIVETSDEWIATRTGMKTRHISSDAEPVWLMGREAAKLAIKESGVSPEEIGLIIFTTVTPDYYTPSMGCIVQRELGIPNAAAFDVNAACAGFAYALDMARRYLLAGDIAHVLIVSAEANSQIVDYKDRSTCVLFGDGAGAVILTAADLRFGSHIRGDISGTPLIYVRKPRRANPFVKERPEPVYPFESPLEGSIYMNGNQVYKFATKAMPEAIEKACGRAGAAVHELDLLIPHQANLRIIETAMKHLELPAAKCYVNIQNYGNTSRASIAIALDECVRTGRVKRGDLIGAVGFGAGLTLGACVFEY
jgi:3-oxoacyl-[acyl-carrier-protein] synthase-3